MFRPLCHREAVSFVKGRRHALAGEPFQPYAMDSELAYRKGYEHPHLPLEGESPASLAAQRDKRGLYAVCPAAGGLVIAGRRSEATELAQKMGGSWTPIPR